MSKYSKLKFGPLTKRNLTGQTWMEGRGLCFDFEVSRGAGEEAHWTDRHAHVICLCWETTDGVTGEHYGHIDDAKEFWRLYEEADFLIAHHEKYEGGFLLRMGVDPADHLWADPMLMEWVLLGNNPDDQSLALEVVGPKYGSDYKDPRVQLMFEMGMDSTDIPAHWLLARCRSDVRMTMTAFKAQLQLLHSKKLLHLAVARCLLAPILVHMEMNEIVLDAERTRAEHRKATAELSELRMQLNELCGGPVKESSPNMMIPLVYGLYPEGTKDENKTIPSLGFKEPTDKRGKPLRGAKSKSWPEGRPLLNKKVIAELSRQAKTKRQKEWIKLRGRIGKVSALLSKNLDFFLGVVEERNCRFAGELMQAVTDTHRLSGRGRPIKFKMFDGKPKSVQTQNTPRELKGLQTAPPGRKSFDVDGSQLEFRSAAFQGNDPVAKADISDPRFDAHIQTLCMMLYGAEAHSPEYNELFDRYKAGDKEVKKMRADNDICKSHTFKPLYGGTRGTEQQEAYYAYFNRRYAGVAKTQETWLQRVERGLPVVTCTGLEFRYNVEHNDRGVCIKKQADGMGKPIKPSVYNHPIQYFATGEMIPISIIWLFYIIRQRKIDAVLNNTVHDSVSGHLHPSSEEAFKEAARDAFTTHAAWHLREIYGIVYDVPFGVECTIGSHVGEGESVKYDWLQPVGGE